MSYCSETLKEIFLELPLPAGGMVKSVVGLRAACDCNWRFVVMGSVKNGGQLRIAKRWHCRHGWQARHGETWSVVRTSLAPRAGSRSMAAEAVATHSPGVCGRTVYIPLCCATGDENTRCRWSAQDRRSEGSRWWGGGAVADQAIEAGGSSRTHQDAAGEVSTRGEARGRTIRVCEQ